MVSLHDYQDEAVTKAIAELDRAQAALLVMPTGCGKSLCGAAVAGEVARRGGRTLILIHRKEFIAQWGRACDALGLAWAVEQAENNARRDTIFGRADIVIGSKDTLQKKRLERWSPNTFSSIIVDECHHGSAGSWKNVFGHFHSAKRLGLTATPERTDEESIQPVFGNVAYELPFWKAVDQGYIAAPFFRKPEHPIDLSMLRSTAEDLNQGDLEDVISKHVEQLINGALDYLDDRPILTFTPRVFSATAMADGFRQLQNRPVTSCSVSGKSDDRDKVIQDFRAGRFRNLCSCELLREGTDFPDVGNLVMARPTKSGLVFRQMLGRALRKKPENYANIIDYSWNSGKHNLFRPIDLFDATGMDLDVLKLAGKYLDEGEPDARKALEKAERVHAQEVALRVRVQERTPSYKMLAYDPFQVGSLLGIPNRQREGQKPCSAKTRARLQAEKLNTGSISDVQARRLLKELDQRRAVHLGTHRKVALLVSKGVPIDQARTMTSDQVDNDLDILIGSERKRA